MATPIRFHRALVLSTTATAALAGSLVLGAPSSSADPRPTVASVQAQIGGLQLRADQAVEAYDSARLELATAQRQASAATARVAEQQARTDRLRDALDSLAAAAYRSGGSSQLASLLLDSDPQTVLDQASALDQIAGDQTELIGRVVAAQRVLERAQDAADREVQRRTDISRRLLQRQTEIEKNLATQQAIMSRLQASERSRLDAAQRSADRAATTRSRTLDARGNGGSTAGHGSTAAPAASGRASVALRFAYAQLGKPYQWGADGPGSFDCSGLTMRAWGAAGVGLPHSSQAQFGSGTHVSSPAPGDLVFYGSPIHHVAMYVGNGLMISAPHTGDVVKIQPAFRSDYVGAVRP